MTAPRIRIRNNSLVTALLCFGFAATAGAEIDFDRGVDVKAALSAFEFNTNIPALKAAEIGVSTESYSSSEDIAYLKDSLLITFDPGNMTLVPVNSFKSCNNPEAGGQPVLDQNMFSTDLKKECQPDTVYSWGSREKAESLFAELKNSPDWKKLFSRPVYTSFLAAGTFPYGAVPIRFKLRPGLTYEHSQTCPSKFKEKNSDTVYYAQKAYNWMAGGKPSIDIAYEILLCSPSVIESVSYGYPEHYDEVVREILWRTTPGRDPNEYYSYFHGGSGDLDGARLSPDINLEGRPFIRFSNGLIATRQTMDGHEASVKTLALHMKTFKDLATLDKKNILFNPGLAGEAPTRKHFSTGKPIYFNPE